MLEIINYLRVRYLSSKKGQGMVEYALILAAVAAIGALVFSHGVKGGLGAAINKAITSVTTQISG